MNQFGVAYAQVERDPAISHVLAALAASDAKDDLVFLGGTALARTYLPDLRLSEDIDLITSNRRSSTARMIASAMESRLRRTLGRVTWQPSLIATSGSGAATMIIDDRIPIQIQLLSASGYPRWPTTVESVRQRYRDAPPALLPTLTPVAFAAAKTSAWYGRAAPRDLYDLWALAETGAIDAEATKLYRRHGPTTGNPADLFSINSAPTDRAWEAALAHQCRIRVGPDEAMRVVRTAWTEAAR
ncbi:nucleotidyl transferase AbiEii/AbiGii toxin family protein [Microlunatus elymi]|uniref:Nucleotidyl transferase AbiEii/AbiGii toxin family protein n=1 Tax=Microlunatus elymi TaxID=2596828 RepID=A0A516Q1R8_9ACTN|nr:nucleotidyl transferase AbiEii/AbiGii toxin family protein [Microlunatus elymi]QDP97348.1 nucleotidyl transferase AbiEii/AbiGii toxin family protein [Microlunatus elymi]